MMKMIIPSGPRPPQAAEKNQYFSSFFGKNRGYSPLVFYTFETRGGITARNTTDNMQLGRISRHGGTPPLSEKGYF